MKVLIIDPVTATIRTEEWDKDLKDVYKWLRCDTVQAVACGKGLTLWVDEDGGMKSLRVPRWCIPNLYPQPIIGAAMLVKSGGVTPELETELNALVKWGLLFNPHDPAGRKDH